MAAYIVRRLLWLPFLLAIVSFITFGLGLYGPGDPVKVLMGQHVNPEVLARIRHERGLDQPFLVQYASYVGSVLHGDFGTSFKYPDQSVSTIIAGKIWVSAQLGLAAIALALIIGLPLGLIAALKQGTWLDTGIVSFTLVFMSLGAFITAPLMLLFVVVTWHLLPSGGWGGVFDKRIILPALALGLPSIAGWTRLMRASTTEVLGQDFVRTARAKGLTEYIIQVRHVARNALIPIITMVGLSLGGLVEGAFITEGIFGIPGIGRLALDSIYARDYPVIMAITLVIAIAFVAANLLVDLTYGVLDPRIRLR